MGLTRNTHHVFRIMYHFVWIPKYRHKIFTEPYRENLARIITKIGYDYNIEIVELSIPLDHIDMIAKAAPNMSPSSIMQIIKSISAREFFKLYPELKQQYFWGGKLWTESFFLETVGNLNEQVLGEYVGQQLEKMDKVEQGAKQLKLF